MDYRSRPVVRRVKLFADSLNPDSRFPQAYLMHCSKRTELCSLAFAARSGRIWDENNQKLRDFANVRFPVHGRAIGISHVIFCGCACREGLGLVSR